MAISFHYQVPEFVLPQKKKSIEWILLAAFLERKEVEHIDYVFCDDEFLLQLNDHFLHHKTYTDIITFDYSTKRKIVAEIYISVERVRENALIYKTTFNEELRRVIIHGVLHCTGYSDKTKRGELLMRKKENEYLGLFSEMTNVSREKDFLP